MALRCAEDADSKPDSLFYCAYFVYLLQYMLTLAMHGARGLRQGCFLIFLGAPPVVRHPATLSTAIEVV